MPVSVNHREEQGERKSAAKQGGGSRGEEEGEFVLRLDERTIY